ncbi:MAG: peptidoglycan DD-metalloendopeptidase family protein [Pseudomonadota bacterium]
MIERHHLLFVAFLSVCLAIVTLVTPTDEVAATKPEPSAEEVVVIDGSVTDFAPLAELAEATATADELTEAPAPSKKQLWEEFIVQSGDNLSLLFGRAGFSDRDVYQIVATAPQGKNLERIYPGQTLAFLRDETGGLAAIRHNVDQLHSVTYRRMDGGFSSETSIREPEVRQNWTVAEIESSLFLAGRSAGMSSNLIMEVANVFAGVIDFALDPRKGDTMEVLYEELYLDGTKLSDGKVIAASFTNRGERFDAFRYTDSYGVTSYYNAEGVSMRKAFLMAPVDFTRVSSNFNPRRLHPIYKTLRPHNGTDYAAPRGTPVFAAGDGRVIEAGYSRPNGNYVFIQHGPRYVTKYLHLNKKKVETGQRVVQSQVIGTVGSTGAATGPHLHYEFLVGGVHKNPRTIHKSLPKAKALPDAELPRFRLTIDEAAGQLAQLRSERTRLTQSDAVIQAAP